MTTLDWPAVWGRVAERLAADRAAGRGHLLTEDTVRMATVLALEEFGVAPKRLAAEVFVAALAGGKVDLVVDPPSGVVIELKYPRDSRTGISPDTMTFGELLRDFIRVASVPAQERWVVQVLNDRLVRYLTSAGQRYGMRWAIAPGHVLQLNPAAIGALPITAGRAIGNAALLGAVTATCTVVQPVGALLTLYAYRVDGLAPEVSPMPNATASATAASPTPPPVSSLPRGERDGARREIIDAIASVIGKKGDGQFTMPEIVQEMHRRGTRYADSTIRTMIGSHMCADAQGQGIAAYADLRRVDRGRYELNEPRSV